MLGHCQWSRCAQEFKVGVPRNDPNLIPALAVSSNLVAGNPCQNTV